MEEEKNYPVDTNRLPEIEGMKDALTAFVYSEIFPLYRKVELLDPNNDMKEFSEGFLVLEMAEAIPIVYLSKKIAPEEKERLISEGYERALAKCIHCVEILKKRIQELEAKKNDSE